MLRRGGRVPEGDRYSVKSGSDSGASERDPAFRVAALVAGVDRRAAAAAGPARAAADPGLLAPAPGARGDLAEPVLVRFEQPLASGRRASGLCTCATRRTWRCSPSGCPSASPLPRLRDRLSPGATTSGSCGTSTGRVPRRGRPARPSRLWSRTFGTADPPSRRPRSSLRAGLTRW